MEVVERKGLGHPDTICDAIADTVSVQLSRLYLERVGEVLHHNLDKGLLAAGSAETRFGGGRVLKPMRLVMGDRATYHIDDQEFAIVDISKRTAKDWVASNLRNVDPDRDVEYQVEIKPGSASLLDLFKRRGMKGSNDTSAAVGYWPPTETERIVLDLEHHLNSKGFKKRFPETGEDVKVMACRRKRDLDLIVAMPMVDRFIRSVGSYFSLKKSVLESVNRFLEPYERFSAKRVLLNALDRRGAGESGVYLTVTGTSAECGDSGQIGRGNRSNGVISLNRPSSSEAFAGKNPVNHIGKIYDILSFRLAKSIQEDNDDIREACVWIMGVIGRPIDQPLTVSVGLLMKQGASLSSCRSKVEDIVKESLQKINKLCDELARKSAVVT